MKKRAALFPIILAVSMALAGCTSSSQTASETKDTEAQTTEALAGETQNADTSGTEENQTETAVTHEMRDISAKELVSEMNIGWNLGNTLDSVNDDLDITADPVQFETTWGAQYTTQMQIDEIINKGFNVIRIPCSWRNHIYDDGNYTIEESWMNRVQEVVDYAYNSGAYVILNIHHEDWHLPYEANKEASAEELKAVWTQIGNRFEDYGDHLIFEGMNEPRKLDTGVEWTGDQEGREVVQYYNKVFVDTIRSLSGNNPKRHLMITDYAASSMLENLKSIEVPENDDKIIISVHAYIPYFFALAEGNAAVSEWNHDTRDIDELMKNLDELFISKGVPVIIGEFAAINRDNEDERVKWAEYYVGEARKKGIVCCWWDNHSFKSGECCGLLRVRGFNMKWEFSDLVDAMMREAYKETGKTE